jgi:hypothetical protein
MNHTRDSIDISNFGLPKKCEIGPQENIVKDPKGLLIKRRSFTISAKIA